MKILEKKEKTYSYTEYIQLENTSREKHDFYYGEVFNMAGGTKLHNEIVNEVFFCLRNKSKKKECKIYTENVKLELEQNNFYVYPDLMLTCNEADLKNNKDTIIRHPSIIIEILSPSTELYDRNIKKKHYLELPSLKYYLLISQDEKKIEMYEKIEKRIEYSSYEKPEDIINFKQLNLKITVSDIYNF